eukprot:TRINITY_DN30094_c0_g1_i1.p1 TRINITY_DN30094_c0_g1~~TRINITY_DN30094_c0_g1_i1.p1  ORF type:complete len:575 (-),score=88.81 TRINITY_DN30094_c0_g1_i1:1003-2727(-)
MASKGRVPSNSTIPPRSSCFPSSSNIAAFAVFLATVFVISASLTHSVVMGHNGHLPEISSGRGTARRLTQQQSSHAYVTLLYGDSFLLGVRVLGQSLRLTGTLKDMVVLVSAGVSQRSVEVLQADGWRVDRVNLLRNPNDNYRASFWGVYTKLNVFNMTQYERVVYLDADTIVLSNIDELFGCHGFCANLKHSERFNTGVMVLEPSAEVFESMLAKVEVLPSYTGGDQGFLNSYFHGFYNAHLFEPGTLPARPDGEAPLLQRLHAAYNADVGLYVIANKWMFDPSMLRVVHFTLGPLKPWDWWMAWLLPPVAQWQAFRVALPESLPGVGQGGTRAEKGRVYILAWLPLALLLLLYRQGLLLQVKPLVPPAFPESPKKPHKGWSPISGLPVSLESLSVLVAFGALGVGALIAVVFLVPYQVRPWTGVLLSYEWAFALFVALLSQYLSALRRLGRQHASIYGVANGSVPVGMLDAKYHLPALKGGAGSASGGPPLLDLETVACFGAIMIAAVLLPSVPYVLGVTAILARVGIFSAAGCVLSCLFTLFAQHVARRWYLRGCQDWVQATSHDDGDGVV